MLLSLPNHRYRASLMNQLQPFAVNRRSLLKVSAAAGLVSVFAAPRFACAAALPYMDRIGLQLYTVRDQMAEDQSKTLAAISAAGYRQVELMAIDAAAIETAAIARGNGLLVHSGFMDWRTIATPDAEGVMKVSETIELAERLGLRHVVFGYIGRTERDTPDKCKQIADRANEAAAKAREAGMRMCYHNHSFEFAKFPGGEQTPFDIFVERFDPQQMDFELDVFWVKIGGQDPIAWMRRLAGRITQVHLKDLQADQPVIHDEGAVPPEAFKELGNGVIDIPQVMQLAKEIGVLQCHVEQDQSPAPLDSIAQSLQYLQKKHSE